MVPQNGWFIRVPNPIKMDDLGGFSPYFWFNTQISKNILSLGASKAFSPPISAEFWGERCYGEQRSAKMKLWKIESHITSIWQHPEKDPSFWSKLKDFLPTNSWKVEPGFLSWWITSCSNRLSNQLKGIFQCWKHIIKKKNEKHSSCHPSDLLVSRSWSVRALWLVKMSHS